MRGVLLNDYHSSVGFAATFPRGGRLMRWMRRSFPIAIMRLTDNLPMRGRGTALAVDEEIFPNRNNAFIL